MYLEASAPLCQPFVVYLEEFCGPPVADCWLLFASVALFQLFDAYREEFCDLPVGFGALAVVLYVDLSAGIGSPRQFSSIQ